MLQIVYTKWNNLGDDIFVMNADGSNQTNITNDGSANFEPSWSPDGTKIIYISSSGGEEGIYLMNADGSNKNRVYNYDSAFMWFAKPVISPNGTKIQPFLDTIRLNL